MNSKYLNWSSHDSQMGIASNYLLKHFNSNQLCSYWCTYFHDSRNNLQRNQYKENYWNILSMKEDKTSISITRNLHMYRQGMWYSRSCQLEGSNFECKWGNWLMSLDKLSIKKSMSHKLRWECFWRFHQDMWYSRSCQLEGRMSKRMSDSLRQN